MEGPTPKERALLGRIYSLFHKFVPSLKLILIIALGTSIGGGLIVFAADWLTNDNSAESSLSQTDTTTLSGNEDCNVLGINLHGTLLTYIPPDSKSGLMDDTDVVSSEDVLYYIDQAEKDEEIKAILVEVDSSGGLPVAGEEIASALKGATKPTVGLIRQTGASAAYWAISGTDHIFASKNSDVGSIGVTISYLDNISKNQREGYGFIQLSAGKYKDMGNPDKPLTEEERSLIIRDLDIVHQNFIEAISVNRGIPLENVRKIADGSTVMGQPAKSLGLIDEIGSIFEVKKYLSEKIGEEVNICWN